ncbi:MAG: helix-turn-helix transcriptional regulator [Polyangiaceae bacterium]|nr:helix-turn-helix transcriptional regulator [Polyangiaceae bacterium]
MASVVELDSGLVGMGTLQRGVPHAHDSYLHRQPAALMESWEAIKHLDFVAAAAISQPGQAHRFVCADVFAEHPAALAHCRAFSLEHVLCTAAIGGRVGSFFALSIYRNDPGHPFTETERKTLELLVPHVLEAIRQAKLEQLRRATRTPRPENQAAAIVNRAGVILEAEPDFVELLAEADPKWSGPWLPTPFASLSEARTNERRAIGRLVFRLDPREDLVLVHARRATVVDGLTERENEVARLFASGESTKQVAERLAIAPNTVRVHLGRIYEKLGVVNKAELASMLTGYE